jgi:hypothetical protein
MLSPENFFEASRMDRTASDQLTGFREVEDWVAALRVWFRLRS